MDAMKLLFCGLKLQSWFMYRQTKNKEGTLSQNITAYRYLLSSGNRMLKNHALVVLE